MAVAVLVLLSVATQLRGVGQLRRDMEFLSSWTEALQAAPSQVIVHAQTPNRVSVPSTSPPSNGGSSGHVGPSPPLWLRR